MRRAAKFKPIAPDLRTKIKRVIVLQDAHSEAIRSGDQSFYSDGRHDELLALLPEVYAALDIRVWHDEREILVAALEADYV